MTEKALVAVNDSKAALNAFLEALQLSRRFGFQLGAICVAPPYQGDLSLVGVRALKRTLAEPSLTVLDEAVRIAAEEGVAPVTFTAEGSRHAAIIDLAVKEKYDLIIIGQEPRLRWSSVGSLTASLLRHSPVDILIIPKNQPFRLGRVLHVLNGSQRRSAVSILLNSSVRNDGPASLGAGTNAIEGPTTTTTRGSAMIGRVAPPDSSQNYQPETATAPGEVIVREHSPRGILGIAQKIGVDIIVWEDRGPREAVWTSFVGTRAFRIVRRSRWPVWVIKA